MTKKVLISLILLPHFLTITAHSQWVPSDTLGSPVFDLKQNVSIFYACTATTGVYISHDAGLTWAPSNNGLTNLNTRKILIHDTTLILGTSTGIFKSSDGGQNWISASVGLPAQNVSDIILRGDSILISSYGGIYLSLDNSQTWSSLNNGFPDLYRSCLIDNGGVLFTGSLSDAGIYASNDGGQNWSPRNNGVPPMPYNPNGYVAITSFSRIGNIIYASTTGQGIIKSDNYGSSWSVLNVLNTYPWIIINVDETLMSGHDGGGFCKSNDYGNSWLFENEGLITVYDKDIKTICASDTLIFIGTWSRKVFRRPKSEINVFLTDFEKKNHTMIYPNPISNDSRFNLNGIKNIDLKLQIFNCYGTCIKNCSSFNPKTFILRRNEYVKGIYFYTTVRLLIFENAVTN